MHRLASAKKFYPSSYHGISLTTTKTVGNTSFTEVKCTIYRRILMSQVGAENFLIVRHQSTKPANLLSSGRKKKHKSYKKYGELLEVVNEAMTETKVSISKLLAVLLTKLTSLVSLGQLHQLTTKPVKSSEVAEVDSELLQSVRDKVLKKTTSTNTYSTVMDSSKRVDVRLDYDKCALIYTSHKLSNIEDKFKTKQYIDFVKESYYNFRKATIYDQRLQSLRYAITEGLTQEFNLNESTSTNKTGLIKEESSIIPLVKGPHAVFRERFEDNHLNNYHQELMSHITNIQAQGLAFPAIEDIYGDPTLHNEIADTTGHLHKQYLKSHYNISK